VEEVRTKAPRLDMTTADQDIVVVVLGFTSVGGETTTPGWDDRESRQGRKCVRRPRRPRAAVLDVHEHGVHRDRRLGGDVRADRGRRRVTGRGERGERDGRENGDVRCASVCECD
jgi:hypothetical protein